MHVDYITIPGATLDVLVHAFRLDYEQLLGGKGLDVVIVAGYNDLVRDYGREYIMAGFQELGRIVMDQSSRFHPEVPNTFAIVHFIYPPQLAWFPDNGPEPTNYVNKKEKLDWLNEKIEELNNQNGALHVPKLTNYGLRKATRKWFDVYGQEHHREIKGHRWEHWRESDPANMLHLNNDRRFKVAKAIQNYFILRTGINF